MIFQEKIYAKPAAFLSQAHTVTHLFQIPIEELEIFLKNPKIPKVDWSIELLCIFFGAEKQSVPHTPIYHSA